MPSVSTRLSDKQIAAYASQAGWKGKDLTIAVAVALAESGGRPNVVNSIGCVGLWQVNQPVHVKDHPLWTREWLKNPANNAQAAHTIQQQQGWARAFTTYSGGAYKVYSKRAEAAVAGIGIGPSPITSTPQFTPDATQLSANAIDFWNAIQTPEFWARIGLILVGCILVIMGLMSISNTTGKVAKAAKVALNVTPQGRVAKGLGAAASGMSKVTKATEAVVK